MKAASCTNPGYTLRPAPTVAHGHARDQVLLEPVDRLAHGQLVDLGGVDARVDRARHQRHAARLGSAARLGHDCCSCEHLHARLADGDDVRAAAQCLQPVNEMIDVIVEPEAAFIHAHVTRIVPIGYADIVVRQQRAHEAAQQCGKVPRERCHHQNLRLGDVHILLEAQQRTEGRHRRRLLAHGDFAVSHADAVDAVGRARMREAGARYELVGGREVAQDFEVLRGGPRSQRVESRLRK